MRHCCRGREVADSLRVGAHAGASGPAPGPPVETETRGRGELVEATPRPARAEPGTRALSEAIAPSDAAALIRAPFRAEQLAPVAGTGVGRSGEKSN